MLFGDVALSVTHIIIVNFRILLIRKVNILIKSNIIIIVYSMKMLDTGIVCINVWVQLYVSFLVTCVNRITTRRYAGL